MATKSNSSTNNYLVVTILKLRTKLFVGEVRKYSEKLDQKCDPKGFFSGKGFRATTKQFSLSKF